jgi:fibronectin type 3 domain-containing protein
MYALAGNAPSSAAMNSSPYAQASTLNDVTSGSNGTCSVAYLCKGEVGYDAPTGLGTPNGIVAFSAGPVVTTVPTAPAGLVASGGSAVVNLSWSAPSSNGGSVITGYNVYRGTASGAEALLTTLGPSTSYSDSAVVSGTTYYYKVTAVNGVGEGPKSNEASAASIKTTVPTAPRNLTARTATQKGVTLAWSAPSSNGGSAVSSYRIYRGTRWGGETSYTIVTCATSTCSYTDSTTISRATYYYEVAAINSVGTGPLSNQASARAR